MINSAPAPSYSHLPVCAGKGKIWNGKHDQKWSTNKESYETKNKKVRIKIHN